MMTSSNGNIFRVTGPLCGEFTGPGEFPAQRPVTRSFDVFFGLRLNTRLSKQPWGWWFETPSWPLWRHYYASPCLDSAKFSLVVNFSGCQECPACICPAIQINYTPLVCMGHVFVLNPFLLSASHIDTWIALGLTLRVHTLTGLISERER